MGGSLVHMQSTKPPRNRNRRCSRDHGDRTTSRPQPEGRRHHRRSRKSAGAVARPLVTSRPLPTLGWLHNPVHAGEVKSANDAGRNWVFNRRPQLFRTRRRVACPDLVARSALDPSLNARGTKNLSETNLHLGAPITLTHQRSRAAVALHAAKWLGWKRDRKRLFPDFGAVACIATPGLACCAADSFS